MTRKDAFVIMLLVVVCGLLWSCDQERDPCLLPTNVNMRVRCMQATSDTTVADTALENMNLAAIDVDTQKFLYVGADEIVRFNLRLSPVDDSSMFVIQPDSAITPLDTLVFHYSRSLEFLSNACGYTYFYQLNGVSTTHNNIDSVKIINPSVTTDVNTNPQEHVQIYF